MAHKIQFIKVKNKNINQSLWRVANNLAIWHFWTVIIADHTICSVFKECNSVETDSRKFDFFACISLVIYVIQAFAIFEVEVISFPFAVAKKFIEGKKLRSRKSYKHTSSSCKIAIFFFFSFREYNLIDKTYV